MRTAILTMIMNEEDLLPFFLKHYSFVDRIFILLDSASNDKTQSICMNTNNVEIIDFSFPDMFDADIKRHMINTLYRQVSNQGYDWIIAVDLDEFIFFDSYLNREDVNVVRVKFWQIYKHVSEGPLDINKPIWEQRRHGDPDFSHNLNYMYIKPCIAKANIPNFEWGIGSHDYVSNKNVHECPSPFIGAHWRMADVNLAIKRRLMNKARQSKNNLSSGYQLHDHFITEEAIINECKDHENDPQLF